MASQISEYRSISDSKPIHCRINLYSQTELREDDVSAIIYLISEYDSLLYQISQRQAVLRNELIRLMHEEID